MAELPTVSLDQLVDLSQIDRQELVLGESLRVPINVSTKVADFDPITAKAELAFSVTELFRTYVSSAKHEYAQRIIDASISNADAEREGLIGDSVSASSVALQYSHRHRETTTALALLYKATSDEKYVKELERISKQIMEIGIPSATNDNNWLVFSDWAEHLETSIRPIVKGSKQIDLDIIKGHTWGNIHYQGRRCAAEFGIDPAIVDQLITQQPVYRGR